MKEVKKLTIKHLLAKEEGEESKVEESKIEGEEDASKVEEKEPGS